VDRAQAVRQRAPDERDAAWFVLHATGQRAARIERFATRASHFVYDVRLEDGRQVAVRLTRPAQAAGCPPRRRREAHAGTAVPILTVNPLAAGGGTVARLSQIVRAAVYYYARTGQVPPGFDGGAMRDAMSRLRGGRPRAKGSGRRAQGRLSRVGRRPQSCGDRPPCSACQSWRVSCMWPACSIRCISG
jgi:hypothetical protein